jgi:hypothetical protein
MFENRMLRRISGPKRKEGNGENYILRCFRTWTDHQILLGLSGRDM